VQILLTRFIGLGKREGKQNSQTKKGNFDRNKYWFVFGIPLRSELSCELLLLPRGVEIKFLRITYNGNVTEFSRGGRNRIGIVQGTRYGHKVGRKWMYLKKEGKFMKDCGVSTDDEKQRQWSRV